MRIEVCASRCLIKVPAGMGIPPGDPQRKTRGLGFVFLFQDFLEGCDMGHISQTGDPHAGEAEALGLTLKETDGLLTDDTTTRLFVFLLGLEVHGSLGIILWNAAKGYLSRDEAESALERLEGTSPLAFR